MKIVLNKFWGGYGYDVAEEFKDFVRKYENDRTNPELIAFVEENPYECPDLEAVEIPDGSVIYAFENDDGYETIRYKFNGKSDWA